MEVLKLCAVKLLFTASNFVIPFAALFVGKHYDFGAGSTAALVTALSVCYLGGNLAGGYVGDKFQSRNLLRIFAALSFVLMLISSLQVPVAVSLATLALFSGLAGAASPVLSNFLSNSVTEWNRERAFGHLYLAHNLGIAVVFVAGGFLLDRDTQYPLYFFTAVAGLCWLSTLLLQYNDLKRSTATVLEGISQPTRVPVLLICSFVLFFALAFLDAQREYQLPMWLDSLNGASSASWFGTIGIVNAVVVLLMTTSVIKMTTRWSPISNMGLAAVFYAAGFGLHYLLTDIFAVLALVVLWSIGEILGATYMNVHISKNAPSQYRAKLFSLIPVVLTLGKILSISTTTQITASYDINTGWLLAIAVGLGATAFSLIIGKLTFQAYAHDKARHSAASL